MSNSLKNVLTRFDGKQHINTYNYKRGKIAIYKIIVLCTNCVRGVLYVGSRRTTKMLKKMQKCRGAIAKQIYDNDLILKNITLL